MKRETYIGDGLYVSFDGFHFILRAPRPDGDHWVGLQPDTVRSFEAFVRRIRSGVEGRTKPVKRQ